MSFLLLISSQRVTLQKTTICNPYIESPITADNCMQANYSWRLKGHFLFKSNLNLFYGKQQWTIHIGHFVVQILQII